MGLYQGVTMIDWTQYPNFSEHEFVCKQTGTINMQPEFMAKLQALRTDFGKPMRITSGFRSHRHDLERKKDAPGTHAQGIACDIGIGPGAEVHRLVELAIYHGFTGIGISQKNGLPRFVHLDTAQRHAIWSY
jgi:zinc D-Ala-D-Ala carboxypeptidase